MRRTFQYKTKNIAWMSELPNRSNATPIVAGDRIFVMSEPDELVCIDARTGRKLWSAINDDYQALPPRTAHPQFAVNMDPLYQKLAAGNRSFWTPRIGNTP